MIGYSTSANRILVVILRPVDPGDIEGTWYGVNAWPANSTQMKRYQREG